MTNETLEERVRRAVRELGASETARRLGLTVEPVLRIAAGAGIQNGTRVLAASNLARLDEASCMGGR